MIVDHCKFWEGNWCRDWCMLLFMTSIHRWHAQFHPSITQTATKSSRGIRNQECGHHEKSRDWTVSASNTCYHRTRQTCLHWERERERERERDVRRKELVAIWLICKEPIPFPEKWSLSVGGSTIHQKGLRSLHPLFPTQSSGCLVWER